MELAVNEIDRNYSRVPRMETGYSDQNNYLPTQKTEKRIPHPHTGLKDKKINFKGRVLIVEDNKLLGEILSECVNEYGLETELASNGIEALTLLEKSSFDLVLTDLQMPKMDGIALAKILQEKKELTPKVVIVTGSIETNFKGDDGSFLKYCDAHLQKPYRDNELYDILSKYFN